MGTIQALLHNYVLVVAVSGWLIAQLIKTITVLITTRHFDVERLTGAGGMPSAHSAAVCGMAIAVAKTVGVGDPLFALAFLFASVVMYDATGVRRAAGEQAKRLNVISSKNKLFDDMLKESLGHTPLEVLAGALLGILLAMIIPQ